MFVSVVVDPGSESRANELAELLAQFGFDKVQRGLWESPFVSPGTLNRIKRDLDRATDAFDRIRIFQFPVEGTLVITTLRDKKWRRMVAKGGADSTASRPAAHPAGSAARHSAPASRPAAQRAAAHKPAAQRAGSQRRPAAPARPAAHK